MRYAKPLQLFEQLMRTKACERGRLLCLDVRDKYVGLSVSAPDNLVATPLRALLIERDSRGSMADKFQTLISEHNLAGFVFSTPVMGPNRDSSRIFVDDLCKTATGNLQGIMYTYWNSSCTSKSAENMNKCKVELYLKLFNLPQYVSDVILDQFDAVNVLQAYLEHGWQVHWDAMTELEVTDEDYKLF